MHIGLFGGTFDPVHSGHLIIAESIRCRMGLDQILFIPAAVPPHKQESTILSEEHRVKMLHLAVGDNAFFKVSDYEIRQGGISYTIDTIVHFQDGFPDHRFQLIIGSDSLDEIDTWKDPDRIFDLIPVIAAGRPGFELDQLETPYKKQIQAVQTPLIDISSSFIRESVLMNRSIRYLVPDSVEKYINKHGLYKR